jgi:hypothetical protein
VRLPQRCSGCSSCSRFRAAPKAFSTAITLDSPCLAPGAGAVCTSRYQRLVAARHACRVRGRHEPSCEAHAPQARPHKQPATIDLWVATPGVTVFDFPQGFARLRDSSP